MYKELRLEKITKTVSTLNHRINERLPDSSIGRVCGELHDLAVNAKQEITLLSKPHKWIRFGVFTVMVVFIALLAYTFSVVQWEYNKPNLVEVIQITEALINDVVLLGAALFFLLTLERRIKSQFVLKALHRLRSIAHVVDMHQLTKDPSVTKFVVKPTKSSPKRTMTQPELQRYLDYCSEMYSLIGKIAALYSERLPEPDIVSAANDIESLCTGLSQKVWQKMVFLKAH